MDGYKKVKHIISTCFQGLRHFSYHLWAPEKLLDPLLINISEDREKLQELISELTLFKKIHLEYVSLLEGITGSMNAMIWSKDQNYKYLVASEALCNLFFGLETSRQECLFELRGKTYSKVMENCFNNHELSHLGLMSDQYVEEQECTCHFIEAAKLCDREVLLYIVKIPVFKDGSFTGIDAIAWDVTAVSDFVTKLLNRWIYDERATVVYKRSTLFSYSIAPQEKQCAIFSQLCPNPMRGERKL